HTRFSRDWSSDVCSSDLATVRWGIIGVGDVTEVKSGPAFYKTKHSELVAVMRRNAEKAADYARRHNVAKWYSNASDLINDPGVRSEERRVGKEWSSRAST